MKAKDTVMVRPEIQRIWTEAIDTKVLAVAPDAAAVSSLLAVARAQAEISFKAGWHEGWLSALEENRQHIIDKARREVVEWLRQYAIHGNKVLLEDVLLDLKAHSPYGKPN